MEKNTICQDQKKASPEATVTEIGKEENKKQGQEQKTTRHGKITVTALIEDKARVTTLPPSTARKVSLRWVYSSTHSPAGPRTHTMGVIT